MKKNNGKIVSLCLLASTLILASCSSTSCFNPCNWRPFWMKPYRQPVCDYPNFEGDYNSDYTEGPSADGEPASSPSYFSPYPDTTVEEISQEEFPRESSILIQDHPYYDEKYQSNERDRMYNSNMLEETPSIQQQDLEKIKSAHQRVLDRYRIKEETAEESDFFDPMMQRTF